MKFNGIDRVGHFPDVTLFWAIISDVPAELRSSAKLIDGKEYDENCFGVCVIFDAGTKGFALQIETDRDIERTIYYIDNDGYQHWFACEIPKELTERIFSECQQILDFQKTEDGYTIMESIQFEDGSGLVLAENLDSERPFMSARFVETYRGQRYCNKQKTFYNRSEAIKDFSERAEYKKQFLRVKPDQPKADESDKKGRKPMEKSKKRPKHKRR